MRIFMACPAPAGSCKGNRVTADRWARFLRLLGHEVRIGRDFDDKPCDCLIALHAKRSFPAVQRYRRYSPQGLLIVALTGTDLYRDLGKSRRALQSLELADRLVVLQAQARFDLPVSLQDKVRVIYQSAVPTRRRSQRASRHFNVCVLGHLRQEKDPFRAALALHRLPASSQIRVTQAGQALSDTMARRAKNLMARDPRYRWIGEVPRGQARRILAKSQLLVLSSRMEGGANVLSEAIADGVPVLASHISGSIGILGAEYPGFFPVADTRVLADLLHRVECDRPFYQALEQAIQRLAALVEPERECTEWSLLLREFGE